MNTSDEQAIRKVRQTIAIIGAGPAGLYTAIALAKKNIPSLLIDKAVYPRDKVCGEALTSNVLRYIQRLAPDLLHSEEFMKAKHVVNGLRFYSPNGKHLHLNFQSRANISKGLDSFIGIRRLHLDNILMEYARTFPLITIIEGEYIKNIERTDSGIRMFNGSGSLEIQAEMVVVSNGYGSKLAQYLTNKSWGEEVDACGITAFYSDVAGISDGDVAECFILPELKSGGLYVLPVGNGIVNVNIALRNDIRKKYGINVRHVLANTLKTHPVLKERFAHAKEFRKPLGHGYHLGLKKRSISGDRFLLIGDAGGFNDPVSANGIAHAMISADIAVESIARAYTAKDYSAQMFRHYKKEVYRAFWKIRVTGMITRPIMLHPKVLFFIVNNFCRLNCGQELLNRLMYAKYPWKLLLNPEFYYAMIQSSFKREKLIENES